jgi:4'-phosphopantetheinyl transferase
MKMNKPLVMLKSLESEAHIWITFIEKQYDPRLLDWYKRILSDDEQNRYKSFYFERHRKPYLISHALLRTTLSRYMNIPPANWVFSYDSYGRPQIDKPRGTPELRFNLSRTQGIAVCLIASSLNAGIDIESVNNLDDPELLYRHVLSLSEIASLQGLPAHTLKKRFLIYWTLKEAYVKAIGKGLSIPLTQFSFKLKSNGKACIRLDPRLTDDSSQWQFAFYWLTKEVILAIALCNSGTFDKNIRLFKVIPGFEHSPARA